jgi:hypothetical protein
MSSNTFDFNFDFGDNPPALKAGKSFTCDIRPGRSFLYTDSPLPKFYYDLEAQKRFNEKLKQKS